MQTKFRAVRLHAQASTLFICARYGAFRTEYGVIGVHTAVLFKTLF